MILNNDQVKKLGPSLIFKYFNRISLSFAATALFTLFSITNGHAVPTINNYVAPVVAAVPAGGTCTSGTPTGFDIFYDASGDTIDTFGAFDNFNIYMVDGAGKVMHAENIGVNTMTPLINNSSRLITSFTPTQGPTFTVYFVDDNDDTADLSPGDTFVGTSVFSQTFNANAIEPDCPAGVVGGGGNSASTQLDNQQSQITSTIITQQTGSFIAGVTDNISSLFDGTGSDPSFNPSGFTSNSSQFSGDFSIQSTGLKRWVRDKRLAMTEARRKKQGGPKLEAVTQAGDQLSDEDLIGEYNFWIKGSGTYIDGEGYSYDGTQFDIVSGIDYRASKDAIIGLLFGYGRTDFDINDSGTTGSFEANGYSAGPYIGLRLDDHVYLDALLVYTRSDYDSASGSTTGQFDADRITGALNLRGKYPLENGMILEPIIGLIYAHEKQEAYADSGGTNHNALTIKAGRVSVGPKLTLAPHQMENGKLTPWVGLKGEYDFSNQSRGATSSLPDLSSFFSLRAQIGLDSLFEDGSKISLKGDLSGLGSNKYIGLGGQIRYDVPF